MTTNNEFQRDLTGDRRVQDSIDRMTRLAETLIREQDKMPEMGVSRWQETKHGKLYLRLGLGYTVESGTVRTVDISNVVIYESYQNAGIFRQILNGIEAICDRYGRMLRVENIMHDHLTDMLKRRPDYVLAPDTSGLGIGPPTYYRLPKTPVKPVALRPLL